MRYKIEQLITIILIFFHLFLAIVLFSYFEIDRYFYAKKIKSNITFSDIVYTNNYDELYFEYYDFSTIKPKHNNHLLNSDVYVSKNTSFNNTLFNLDSNLQLIESFNDKTVLISSNIADDLKIEVGHKITINNDEYTVDKILANYKGYNSKRNREGIVLVIDSTFNSDIDFDSLMYFNYDPEAIFTNSYFVRRLEYFKINNIEIKITLYLIMHLIVSIVIYFASRILKLKVDILSKEKQPTSYLYKVVSIERTLPHILLLFVGYLLYYFIVLFPVYKFTILNVISLIYLSNLLLSFILLFLFITIIKRRKHI